MPDPAAFTVETQQHPGHRKTDQFTVSQLRPTAAAGPRWDHTVVDEHVECGQEGV
jgi:hypothetical protein